MIAKLFRAELGVRAHWSFDGTVMLCGRGFHALLNVVNNVPGLPICKSCASAMVRVIKVAEVLAHDENISWFEFVAEAEVPAWPGEWWRSGTPDKNRACSGAKVEIHTGGELHPVPKMPVPDFGDNLATHFSVKATHHHKHLPVVRA